MELSNGTLVNAAQVTVAFDNAKDATSDTLSNCTESTVAYSAIATFSGCQGLGYNTVTKTGTNVYAGGLKLLASFTYTNPGDQQTGDRDSRQSTVQHLIGTWFDRVLDTTGGWSIRICVHHSARRGRSWIPPETLTPGSAVRSR